MKHNSFSRKTRQLKSLVKQLKFALKSANTPTQLIERLKLKISLLLKELSSYFSRLQLKGIVGSLAVVFGLVINSNAQTFSGPVLNPFGISLSAPAVLGSTAEVDIDGDGDLDLFQNANGGSGYGGALAYFQNTGTATAPVFGASVLNQFGITGTSDYGAPAFVDMDDDGDMDLLVGGYIGTYFGAIQYFQNTGTATAPAFGAPVLNPFGLTNTLYLSWLAPADIDNDGDTDILTVEAYGDLVYFQNTGTASAPTFAAAVANPFGFVPVSGTFSFPGIGDMDGDGDFDLCMGDGYGAILYYQNTGTVSAATFTASVTNPFGLSSVAQYAGPNFVNLDGDCDLDLLVSQYNSGMQYFQNTTVVVIDGTTSTTGLTITANVAGASYQWLDCTNGNAPIVGETSQSFTAVANGSYAVEITTNCGSVVSACVAITTVGLDEVSALNGVKMYPNPSTGMVTLDLGELTSASVTVTGMNGQVVYQNANIQAPTHAFNLKEAAGIYFVEVQAMGEKQVFKLVKN
jgi:hypothetical protein